ncbi:glycosyltransferase [Patulibacter brassicae]|uniref:Glycosyltransferase n=1 Tax=Patulibacter brassicae TaxID=1705717 RepID=A0ABU4VIN5_9ACTN|nr:glycosyltransferase [Patulibacter brassicae]MDX8151648.1 glycosyltransferase [Patulibacter brassicae]
MLGVVFASGGDLGSAAAAVRSWRSTTASPATVLVDHPDLKPAHRRIHGPGTTVLSWADLDVAPGDAGALLVALAARTEGSRILVGLPVTSFVLHPPGPLVSVAEDGGVAVARRFVAPPDDADGLRPSAEDVVTLGATHPRLFACRAGDPRLAPLAALLDVEPARRDVLLESEVPGLVLVEDPGIGLAWWNVHERPLAGSRPEDLTAASRPLAVADLDGWSARHEHLPHPDMSRLRPSEDGALRVLVRAYGNLRASVVDVPDEPDPWPGDPVLRTLLSRWPAQERMRVLRDDPGARERFLAWVGESDAEETVWGLNRYLVELRRGRYDLQAAFADLDDRDDARRLVEWARTASGLDGRLVGLPAALADPPTDPEMDPEVVAAPYGGVNVIGLFDESALGVAEIARQVADGLEAGGIPVDRVRVDRRGRPRPADGDAPFRYRVTLACLNADLLPVVLRRLRRRVPANEYRIAVWWWELEQVPDSWRPAIGLVHEIWAGTAFVAAAFERAFDGPVRHVPLGAASPSTLGAARPRDGRYVLSVFDYASRAERKNPVGAIEAFARANPPADVRLVVKSVGGRAWPREAERVRLAALDAGVPVELVDERLPAEEHAALVAGAAAHLALHRAEGLGLTIVESMLRGVPVVATDYGGSTDLLDDRTGWPIPWTPGRVPSGLAPYPEGARWAEPDLGAASGALREVLAAGPAVAERVARARQVACERTDRIRSGADLVPAVREVLERLREEDRQVAREREDARLAALPQPRRTAARARRYLRERRAGDGR